MSCSTRFAVPTSSRSITVLAHHRKVRRLDRDTGFVECRAQRVEIGRGARDLPALALGHDVLGAGVERGQHQVVLVDRIRGTTISPLRSNCQATAPGSAIDPPRLEKMLRRSEPVRFRLSVSTSISTATPAGPYPS